jgi:hypothetical protein
VARAVKLPPGVHGVEYVAARDTAGDELTARRLDVRDDQVKVVG